MATGSWIRVDKGRVALLTRRGHDWTERFPTIRDAVKGLPVATALIDGEAVVEVDGISDFSALQAALGAREGPGHKAAHEAVFYAFDLLHLDGADLSRMPLAERKQVLAGLVEGSTGAIRYSEHLSEGEGLFKHACLMGLAGIISKRADRPYRSGRYDDWVKIKCVQRQEFVVAGYLRRSDDPKAAGALVLGVYDGGKLDLCRPSRDGFYGEHGACTLDAASAPPRRGAVFLREASEFSPEGRRLGPA